VHFTELLACWQSGHVIHPAEEDIGIPEGGGQAGGSHLSPPEAYDDAEVLESVSNESTAASNSQPPLFRTTLLTDNLIASSNQS